MSVSGASEATLRDRIPALRALRHRDFSWLLGGAFFSFFGSWIQTVAQGWLIYDLTRSEAMLALVSFCQTAPVAFFGPLAGAVADLVNRRVLLLACYGIYAASALTLGILVALGQIAYWHIIVASLLQGLVLCVEVPARQSLVSRVVPPQDLPAAIPLQGMMFNLARMAGPFVGARVLAGYGPQTCYVLNSISYAALALAVLAIRADLRAVPRELGPIKDLVLGGMRYVLQEPRLKMLFGMEGALSFFGLFYISLMPAITRSMLGGGAHELGNMYSFLGLGAIAGLVLTVSMADRPLKSLFVRLAMTSFGIGLVALSFVREPWMAYPILLVTGASSIVQLNTTNTLFQMLSPDHLRGRTLAMHIWAISGLGPFGTLLLGWLANQLTIPFSLRLGGGFVLAVALWAWARRARLAGI